MTKRFDLIIFDWDGTLIDSIDWIVTCLQGAAEACRCVTPSAEALRDVIGLGLHEALTTLFPEADAATRRQLVIKYGEIFHSRRLSRHDLFEGVDDMLMALKKSGYRLAVATGKTRAGLDRAMRDTHLDGVFDASRCADETASKPDPTMLFQLMAQFGADCGRTLMIGDSVHDLKMAGNANIPSIGVTCGAHDGHTLSRHAPMACLPNTVDLLEILTHERVRFTQ